MIKAAADAVKSVLDDIAALHNEALEIARARGHRITNGHIRRNPPLPRSTISLRTMLDDIAIVRQGSLARAD